MKTFKLLKRSVIILIPSLFLLMHIPVLGQQDSGTREFKRYLQGGFNILAHHGIYGSTVPARPDGGSYNPSGGDPYTGLGFGVNADYRFIKLLSIHFDINMYSSTTPVAYSGGYATSDWVWEMNGYDQRLVGPFSENVNYSISTTGIRLGVRAYLPVKKSRVEPWLGVYYGFWNYTLGVFSEDKKSTYGNTSGSENDLLYLNIGLDFWDKAKSFGATIFFEGGSPVARNYSIENCLVNGWTLEDYGEGTHLFGYYRLGATLNFISRKKG